MSMPPPIKILLTSFYALIDRDLRHTEKSCQKGCDSCCYQVVYVDALEAYYVGDYLEHLPPNQFEAIKNEWHEWFKKCSELNLFLPEYETPAQVAARDKRYFDHKIKCPFLLQKECSIYQVRPVACRTFFNTGPSDLCMTGPLLMDSHLLKDRKYEDMKALHSKLMPGAPLDPVLLPGFFDDLFH
jgi:Fe-S-cluster containining protein